MTTVVEELNPIILPILRRVLPTLMANEILGINTYRDVRISIPNATYNNFVRLYNRRRTQSEFEIDQCGYPNVYIPAQYYYESVMWCKSTFGKNRYIMANRRIFFLTEADKTLFQMRWGFDTY